MKQIVSLFLSLLALLGIGSETDQGPKDVPSATAEQQGCGDGLSWEVSGGTLRIAGTGKMLDWPDQDSVPWTEQWHDIEKVVVVEGVTSIGQNAFSSLYNAREVSLPGSLTEIGEDAFSGCSSLEELTVPEGVTKLGDSAFMGCGLRRVTLPDSLTELPTGGFFGCTSLEEVFLPARLERVGYACFTDCHRMTSAGEGEGFHFRMDGMEKIPDDLFYNLNGLKELSIPASVTSIGEFAFCGTGLTRVTIPGQITEIKEGAFNDMPDLTEAVIEEGVPMIGSCAFYGCPKLERVTLPGSLVDCMFPFLECPLLTSAGPGEEFAIRLGPMERIPEGMFYQCRDLKRAELPDTVTYIGTGAFQESGITEIRLPEGLVGIEQDAFKDCGSLSRVYYEGSEAQKKEILMWPGNDRLYDVEIQYGKERS